MANLLDVKNVSYIYPHSNLLAVDNISFSLEKGEYLAVLGANGSGKSTLARVISGFLEPSKGSVEIYVDDSVVPSGIVFQSPKNQIVSSITCNDTAFGPENLKLKKEEITERVDSCLSVVGLLEKYNFPTSTLSLGQTQKLAVAGILALSPELLILDESVSMVDPFSRQEILSFLDEYHTRGNGIIHITHDYEEATRADKVLLLNDGKVVFFGDKTEFIKNKQLVSEIFSSELPAPFPFAHTSDLTLVFKNLSFEYPSKDEISTKIFDNINIAFEKGSLTAIMGASGTGKSTLFEIATGLLEPTAGTVNAISRPVLALQECEEALFEMFIADDVAFGPRNHGVKGKQLKEIVKKSMDLVDIPFAEFKDRKTMELSGGEKRKVSLAGIISLDSDILIFDEPTAGLDPNGRVLVLTALQNLAKEGKTVIFSTHRNEESSCANRCIVLGNKGVISDSAPVKLESEIKQVNTVANVSLLRSLKKATVGFYEEKKSLIHILPPVLKYLFFFLVFIPGIFIHNFYYLSGMIFIGFLYSFIGKVPISRTLLTLLKLLPWLCFFGVLQLLFLPVYEGDSILWNFGFIVISKTKIYMVIRTLLHVTAAVVCVYTFLFTTSENDIIIGFSKLIPIRNISLIVIVVFRFIPLLTEEAALIIKVQLIRGGLSSEKGLFKQLNKMLPLFVPLINRTLDRATAISETITARYF